MWLPIALLSYFLNAASLVTNKFLLTQKVTRPAVFTILTCLLGVAAVVLLPFGWQAPTWPELQIELLAGIVFAAALLYMYMALDKGESSRVVPLINGLQPIVLLPLTWWVLQEKISERFLIAFFLIVAGSMMITWSKGKARKRAYVYSAVSAALFAISIALSKYAFNLSGAFITPFVMTRIGSAIFAAALLLWPKNIKVIKAELRQPEAENVWLVVGGQSAGALSSLLYNWAIAISANVTALINALQGLQYVFLLAMVGVISYFWPKALKEKMTPKILRQKIIATVLIIAGLAVLAL